MSKLDELIKELCPDGVEYKRLDDVCEINRGRVMSKDYLRDNAGEFPVYSSQTANNGIFGFIDNYDYDFESITWTTDGANAGSVFYHLNEKFSITNVCGLLRVKNKNVADTRFLYYCLQIVSKEYVNSGMGNPKLMSNVMSRVIIPLPPLPVQREIVRILDSFTELTAELTARKKQYEYYRDALLTLGDEVPRLKIGDFASITRGGNFQKKDFVENGFPCIHYGQMYTHFGLCADKVIKYLSEDEFIKSKKAVQNDIVMAVTSENVEDVCSCVAWIGKETVAVSGHTAIIHHNQNAKYLSYYLHTSMFFEQKIKLAHGTKVIEVTPDKLKNILIPIPSLDVQHRIVSILDRFDTLCNDITTGLPAEIEARKKQYEYYRDKLLTFPEAKA